MPIKTTFNLDDPFIQFTPLDYLSHRDAMQSFLSLGGIGSGKSSGSGASLLRAYMKHGYGMCCMTVKPEETEEICAIAEQQGRAEDIIKISPESGFSHDPFLAENVREVGSETQTLVKLYSRLVEIASGKQVASDSYWNESRDTLLACAIIALKCAKEPVNIENIYKYIITAPKSEKSLFSSQFKEKSYCYSILERAVENADKEADNPDAPIHFRDFDFSWLYWSDDFPNLAEKTRSIVVSTLTSTASKFLTGSLRTVFTENKTRRPCPPELIRTDSKIVIVDMSVKVYEDVGVMANSLYKLLFQKAMERVPLKATGSPVALYADECQTVLNDFDFQFLQTSRSAGVSVFFLTQSINNLITKFGDNGEAKAYNLLGLIGMKFAHKNTCTKSNQFMADLIGQDWDFQSSSSVNMGDDDERITSSLSEQRRYIVEPIEFTKLLSGGGQNNLIVEAIAHNGRIWSNGENHLHCAFKQR